MILLLVPVLCHPYQLLVFSYAIVTKFSLRGGRGLGENYLGSQYRLHTFCMEMDLYMIAEVNVDCLLSNIVP
jgi:hypothetical protein